jgi:hypothetical protein
MAPGATAANAPAAARAKNQFEDFIAITSFRAPTRLESRAEICCDFPTRLHFAEIVRLAPSLGNSTLALSRRLSAPLRSGNRRSSMFLERDKASEITEVPAKLLRNPTPRWTERPILFEMLNCWLTAIAPRAT